MRPAGRHLIESKRPRAQAELRAARTGVAARDAAVGARLSQCEANSTVLQVRLTNPAPQRTNIATYQYRSDSPAFGGLSPRRRPARRRPRAGRARGGCRRRAAAGARGSRFAGGAAPLSRLLASSPLWHILVRLRCSRSAGRPYLCHLSARWCCVCTPGARSCMPCGLCCAPCRACSGVS